MNEAFKDSIVDDRIQMANVSIDKKGGNINTLNETFFMPTKFLFWMKCNRRQPFLPSPPFFYVALFRTCSSNRPKCQWTNVGILYLSFRLEYTHIFVIFEKWIKNTHMYFALIFWIYISIVFLFAFLLSDLPFAQTEWIRKIKRTGSHRIGVVYLFA